MLFNYIRKQEIKDQAYTSLTRSMQDIYSSNYHQLELIATWLRAQFMPVTRAINARQA